MRWSAARGKRKRRPLRRDREGRSEDQGLRRGKHARGLRFWFKRGSKVKSMAQRAEDALEAVQ